MRSLHYGRTDTCSESKIPCTCVTWSSRNSPPDDSAQALKRRGSVLVSGCGTVPHSLTGTSGSHRRATPRPSPAVGAVLDVLAVAEPLPEQILADVTDFGAVEDAHALGLISVDQNGRHPVRLAHLLYGEGRRARATPLRLRADIAEAWVPSTIATFPTSCAVQS